MFEDNFTIVEGRNEELFLHPSQVLILDAEKLPQMIQLVEENV